MTRRRFGAVVGASVVAVASLAATAVAAQAPVTVELTIHHSRFSPSAVVVPSGRPVTIVLRNEDPIDHEWIVGTDPVHDAHRSGTEEAHEHRATEVSVPALTTRSTTMTFPRSGPLTFICHLPGHEAYGMVGVLLVV